jgi:hypothetical protein
MAIRYIISPMIQKRLKEMNLTAEDVIREALNIKAEGLSTAEGVFFPEGTTFLAWYKDEPRVGRLKGGAIVVDGESFTSVSGAAAKVTGRPTQNGWDFWLVKFPGKSEFFPIKTLRDKAK